MLSDKFKELPLKNELLKNLEELSFKTMTPIQNLALPKVIDGIDLIAQAKTGSGKTAVFGLGILNSLDLFDQNIQALILCPTRELAEQVAGEIRKLARILKNIKVLTLCGGAAIVHQEKSLSHGAHIIVGTPGRVLRLSKKRLLDLSNVRTFVLDEADRMLDMGFKEDIYDIALNLPKFRQTLLFSATYPDEIEVLSHSIQRDVEYLKIDTEHTEESIEQVFFNLDSHKDKLKALVKVLSNYRPERLIVFCKTKRIANDVNEYLLKNKISSASIHGDLEQNERTSVLTKFSNQSLSVLVATDVAARGLDIEKLPCVVNYDLPLDPEIYVHRIGRTGRAGKVGLSFSFFVEQENYKLDEIEEILNQKIEVKDLSELKEDQDYDLIPPMKTMYIGGGKKNKLRAGDILGALIGVAGLDAQDVGDISILNILSYVAINTSKIDQAITKLKDEKIKNRKFKIGLA